MLVVRNNKEMFEWGVNSPAIQMDYRGDVVVVFDPSKTNMAMICGTPEGTILDVYEFSGNNRRKGPVEDTTRYCMEVRAFLKAYLKGAHLMLAATEQAVTYKGVKGSHVSNMVLTEIRGNILNFFLEEFNLKVIEVNNWSWKHAILPEGYRALVAKGNAKGSKQWLQHFFPQSPMGYYFESDVSDCFCILMYVIKQYCANYVLQCNRAETCDFGHNWTYTSKSSPLLQGKRVFPYNDRFSFEDNVNFYLNRSACKFVLVAPIDAIDVESIAQHTLLFPYESLEDKEVACIVWRT